MFSENVALIVVVLIRFGDELEAQTEHFIKNKLPKICYHLACIREKHYTSDKIQTKYSFYCGICASPHCKKACNT